MTALPAAAEAALHGLCAVFEWLVPGAGAAAREAYVEALAALLPVVIPSMSGAADELEFYGEAAVS